MCPKWERQKSNDNLEQNWCLGHFGSWFLIFHSIQNVLDLRAIFIDKNQFFGQQPCDISKVWRALKTPIWTLVPIYQVHGSGDLFARHMALRPVQGFWSLDRSPHCNLNTNNDCRPLCRDKCLRVALHKRSSEMFHILQWKIFSSNPLANVSVNAKAQGQEGICELTARSSSLKIRSLSTQYVFCLVGFKAGLTFIFNDNSSALFKLLNHTQSKHL